MTERKTYEFLKHLVTRRLIGCLQDIKTAFSDPEWLELYRKVVGEREFRKKNIKSMRCERNLLSADYSFL